MGWSCDTRVSLIDGHQLRLKLIIHRGGPLVTGKTELTSTYMNTAYSVLTGLNVILGLFSSLAVNMPDFGRFSKNRMAGYTQFIVLPVIGTLGALMPIFVTSAHSYLWGSFQWYLPAVIAKFDSRAAKFFTGASMILACIGNNIAAGTYPFSNDVSGLCPKYINVIRATAFISLFCVISTPWNIIKNATGLLAFLSGYSCMMGPISGIMITDYYILKSKKLNLHEMYKTHGIYYYSKGVNWRAFVAFFIGLGPLIPGFAKAIDNNLNVGGAWKVYTFAWIFGFTTSSTVYWVICTYISSLGEAIIEVAVYPAQLGESLDEENGVAGMYLGEEKKDADVVVEEQKMANSF